MERPPPLAGRGPVVRRHDRPVRRQPVDGRDQRRRRRTATPTTQQLEASEALDVFNAGGTIDPYEQFLVVVGGGPGAAVDPGVQGGGRRPGRPASTARPPRSTASRRRASTSSSNPFQAPPAGRAWSRADGTTVRIVARVPGDDPHGPRAPRAGPPIVDAARAAHPDLRIHVISNTFITDDINALISSGLDDSLKITMPLTFIILLLAFGAIVASVVPLVLAITSLLAAFGILGIYSQVVGPVSPNATQLIVLIGLAVAVDYSLFMITRFRVERRAGRDRAKAIEVSSSTAGRAVFFSGLAVMISLAGLLTLGVSLFTSMAIGTISVVLVSVVGSLTFLPATLVDPRRPGQPRTARRPGCRGSRPRCRSARSRLGPLGARLARPARDPPGGQRLLGRPGHRGHGPADPADGPVGRASCWRSAARSSTCGPGSPTSPPSPTRSTASPAIKLLDEKWPQGTRAPAPGRGHQRRQARRPRRRSSGSRPRASKLAGLSEPVDVTPSRDGQAAMVSFTMAGGQNDEANRNLVRQVRSELDPAVFGGRCPTSGPT